MSEYVSEAKKRGTEARKIWPAATEKINGRESDMAPNNDGGMSFVLDDWGLFARFLMIGVVGGTYTPSISGENAVAACFDLVKKLAQQDANRLVGKIVEISTDGRAAKNDPAIVALAIAASVKESSELAFAALPQVCRIGTHLFTFISIYNEMGKWNALAKRSIAAWYNNRTPDRLAVQLLKYQSRNGWSHRDVLRLAHVKPVSDAHNAMYRHATAKTYSEHLPELYDVVKRLNTGDLTTDQVIQLIADNSQLSWEMIPTKYLSDTGVLTALLPNMGLTALIRKLGIMTHYGVFDSHNAREMAAMKLTDQQALHAQRVHPITVYAAFRQYKIGHGDLGSKTWAPAKDIVSALDSAFYAAFKPSQDTEESYLVGVDISGSMYGATVLGMKYISAHEVAVIMSMAAVREQSRAEIVGFNEKLVHLGITSDMTLDQATRVYRATKWDGGSTNPGALFEYALDKNVYYDKFVVITDNDLNAGLQPMPLLNKYRETTGINAKMAVIATALSRFTIADPKDAGCIDIAGFDSAAPSIIANL